MRIPKIIHIVWVGDESKRPNDYINSWQQQNPTWEVRLWGNTALETTRWRNEAHMKQMATQEWCGVADLMRWEILYNFGGLALDADSECIRPLDDWLLDCEAFSCWENELARPGLIAIGVMATVPQNPFFYKVIRDISTVQTMQGVQAWKVVGPKRLTDSFHKYAYSNLTIWPSHMFLPQHWTGVTYTGPGIVYAKQMWDSTKAQLRALPPD